MIIQRIGLEISHLTQSVFLKKSIGGPWNGGLGASRFFSPLAAISTPASYLTPISSYVQCRQYSFLQGLLGGLNEIADVKCFTQSK